MSRRNEEEIIVISFLIGVLTFFSLRERRIDTIRRNISTSTNDNIKKDWIKIGSDLRKSYNKLTR